MILSSNRKSILGLSKVTMVISVNSIEIDLLHGVFYIQNPSRTKQVSESLLSWTLDQLERVGM